jgi:transmembrane sensor
MENSQPIEERAGAWLLKRESGDWSDVDQAQLTQWLEATALNRVAFLRLEAGWEEANRLKALGAGFPRGTVPSIDELIGTAAPPSGISLSSQRSAAKRPRRVPIWSVAATVLVAIGTLLFTSGPWAGDRYATPIGGTTSVPLQDGSNVTLNTASRIRVQMSDTERRINLAQGEAFFEVVKDAARPFVVQAGNKRITAVGTKFSVRRDGDDVQVFVTEGVVRLEDAGSEPSRLSAGAVAHAVNEGITVENKAVPDVEEFLSWRSGYVVFKETALADAVAEFNRYNERKIVIADPAVAAMRLTGKFRATNYESFVRLLEDTFQIRARYTADRIVLSEAGE